MGIASDSGAADHSTSCNSAVADLSRVPLFADLEARALRALADAGRMCLVEAGATVLREGAPADGLVVVLTGRLRVVKQTADGVHVTLAEIEAGDYVGELALLDGGARSASVVAHEINTPWASSTGLPAWSARASPRAR
jgi:CRP/FNR family transcriptional regulator, cyclic AMP receptor protein